MQYELLLRTDFRVHDYVYLPIFCEGTGDNIDYGVWIGQIINILSTPTEELHLNDTYIVSGNGYKILSGWMDWYQMLHIQGPGGIGDGGHSFRGRNTYGAKIITKKRYKELVKERINFDKISQI